MSDERSQLIEQATELGLDFPSNVKTVKLQNMVDEAMGVTKTPEVDGPAELEGSSQLTKVKTLSKRQKIAERKKAAFATRVVTITNKDPRESHETNTAHLSFENSYFSLAKNVPLDMPVELEVALIKIAAATEMPLHKKEYIDGKATGNMVTTLVKKYAISYGE